MTFSIRQISGQIAALITDTTLSLTKSNLVIFGILVICVLIDYFKKDWLFRAIIKYTIYK